jgi:ElaB/YqjD/DUF883 family membrane-anchored ribosome-binding protein
MVSMAARAKSATDEIARLESLIANLEKKLERARNSAGGGVESDVSAFVGDALAGIMERVRDSAETVTDDLADRATKAGTDAFKKMTAEIENHPIALLAIAAGIGFLLGISRR